MGYEPERRTGPVSRRANDFQCGQHDVMCFKWTQSEKEIEAIKMQHSKDIEVITEELRYQRRQLVSTLVSALLAAAGTVGTFAVLFFQHIIK